MGDFVKIPALIMRGGTSKGAYLMLDDLPDDPKARDNVILSIYGSPDSRQINGIGGADPLTSKVALVQRSSRQDADVDYTFGYVGIGAPHVDYEGNCGNMSAGVGPFAIYSGLVSVTEPTTTVRIFNTNTKKIIEAQIAVKDGEVVTEGDFSISGVPGSGSEIPLNFVNSGGAKTGKLLPSGNVVDNVTLQDGRTLRVSLVDAANPCVFVAASDLGLSGAETAQDFQADPTIIETMDDLRRSAAVVMGLAASRESCGPAVPKVAFVSRPQSYVTVDGETVSASEVDVVARSLALGKLHKAYAVTGGICLGTAALIPGTVVNDMLSPQARRQSQVRIGHPSGVLEVNIELEQLSTTSWKLVNAGISRTAQPIMEGFVYVPRKVFLS
ncbi:2-methylaconitate cis-trans isomerase PrpF family protein [Paludibacterium yongneupense]|uniref:2-methylaconitate cis-trans isomerase PrpF family protein n=1 Tax=Paludibacterium yongneupense TaxID=400061 RepID=UPI000405441F|nr:PrpF domain-containing protein [Paludibacterium yongneupense]